MILCQLSASSCHQSTLIKKTAVVTMSKDSMNCNDIFIIIVLRLISVLTIDTLNHISSSERTNRWLTGIGWQLDRQSIICGWFWFEKYSVQRNNVLNILQFRYVLQSNISQRFQWGTFYTYRHEKFCSCIFLNFNSGCILNIPHVKCHMHSGKVDHLDR